MSRKNGSGQDFGGLLAGVAALITALVGLLVYLGIQPEQPNSSLKSTSSSQPSSPSPNNASPGQSPNSICPSEMTFRELYDFNSRNPLQAKDVCENKTLNLIGYLNSNSVYECSYQNDLKETVQGRCLSVFHDKQFFYSNTTLQYGESEKELLIEINRSLYQKGNHTVKIQAEVSFQKNEYQQQIIQLSKFKVLSYQPLE